MFKPTVFRFDNAVQWPGAGPTTEIHADTVRDTRDEGEVYVFVHASGAAIKVDKSQVTVYGKWEDDTVPNMPTPDAYPDNIPADSKEVTKENSPDTDTDTVSAPIESDTDAYAGGDVDPVESNSPDVSVPVSDDKAPSADSADVPADTDESDDASDEDVSGEELDLLPKFKSKRKKK